MGLRARAKVLLLLAISTPTQNAVSQHILPLPTNLTHVFRHFHTLLPTIITTNGFPWTTTPRSPHLYQRFNTKSWIVNNQPQRFADRESSTMWSTTHTCMLSVYASTVLPPTTSPLSLSSSTIRSRPLPTPPRFSPSQVPYSKHHLPDLPLRTWRLCPLFPSLENVKTQKCFSIPVFYILMDDHSNLAQNRIRSHGSYHTCKPAQLVLGVNMSWRKSSKKLSGTTQQTNYCRRYSDGSATQICEQQCRLRFALWCKETNRWTNMSKTLKRQRLKQVWRISTYCGI